MAKILEFTRFRRPAAETPAPVADRNPDGLALDVEAIMSDYSLSPANRRWILESMLFEIDEQLDVYRRELEQAERKLNATVQAAEHEIAVAYAEFETQVRGMTAKVKKLTAGRAAGQEPTPFLL
ncbi:hypothetical protein GMSM_05120 [Geomonas sp. Red276]